MTAEPASGSQGTAHAFEKDEINFDDGARTEWNDTNHDVRDMQRLGKKQEFKRNFGFLSTLGFVSIYMATWEFVLVSLSTGFVNGGLAGLFWVFIGTVTCYSTIVASLAEMASMAPTSGGQYHWTSEFAPPKYQKILSYASGWQSTLGWIASLSSSVFVVATLIQVVVQVLKPDWSFTAWQLTLLMLAVFPITMVFNTVGAKILPMLETISLFAHLGGWVIFFIILWVTCRPLNDAKDVFVHVVSHSGWENIGVSCLIGQISVIYCNLGSDSIVHISEEVENAGLTVPRAMWWSFILNVILGILMLITMLFAIGPLDAVLEADTPYLALFMNTGSSGIAMFLSIFLWILIFSGNVTALATTAREMFAFSRDRGLPFSTWLSRINPKHGVPDNAVYVTSILGAILCIINIGSSFAFQIIISLSVLGILSTYMLSIGCLILKRLKHEPLPPARWSLGRLGLPVNIFAFFYCGFIIIFSCFPTELPVSLDTANWAPLVWAGVILLAAAVYIVHGRKHYTPPVEFVEGRREAGKAFQSAS